MSLRNRLLLYLLMLHMVLAVFGVALLWQEYRPWIIALELFLIASLLVSIFLTRGFQRHIEIVTTGAQFIKETDFSHTFSEVEASDVNNLIHLYNEMIQRLREERIRQREQHAFLTRVLDASPSGFMTLTLDGEIDMVNPAAVQMLGMSDGELKGKPLNEVPSRLAQELTQLEPGLSTVVSLGGRRRIKCTHSHYYEQGYAHSFFLIEELTEELWRSEKNAYETLIRTLSHEVNNTVGASNSILRSSLVYGEQLRDGDREDFTRALSVAIERTDHLNAFMRGFADVIRLPDPTRQPADLVGLVQHTVELMERECEEREIRIGFDSAFERLDLRLDRVQIEQALLNILRNAIEAVDRSGDISVHLGEGTDGFVLKVEDSGPGLSDEAKQNLFIPFFSTKQHGQGIGLTLVHEILSRHHFACVLESNPGELTRFLITIPSSAKVFR